MCAIHCFICQRNRVNIVFHLLYKWSVDSYSVVTVMFSVKWIMSYLLYVCLLEYSGVQHIMCWVCLRLVYPMMSVFLDYQLFFIAPLRYSLVFIYMYLYSTSCTKTYFRWSGNKICYFTSYLDTLSGNVNDFWPPV